MVKLKNGMIFNHAFDYMDDPKNTYDFYKIHCPYCKKRRAKQKLATKRYRAKHKEKKNVRKK